VNEEKIQFKISDCPKLKEDIEKMQNSYQQEINKLHQELDQYKNNWERLKTYLNIGIGMNFNMNNDQLSEQKVNDYTNILNRMEELEEDK
jgi:hypothetical protein